MQYKERNDELIKERNLIYNKWLFCERALALKTPVREAEYAIDDRTALSLYDCLVPMIKEHRKFSITKNTKFCVADFEAQKKVY